MKTKRTRTNKRDRPLFNRFGFYYQSAKVEARYFITQLKGTK